LTDIDFTVKKGETIGIIGGTGSGKTSLVNLIPRFYDATVGAVRINGKDVRSYPLENLRKLVGVVPQKAVLFKGSIRDNMRWGNPNATDEEMSEALEEAQAMDVINAKKGGLSFEIEQGGKNLSGGQRQRLTIARALVKRPEILILDDSASALDYATDARLRQALSAGKGTMTTFIVSQRASSIRHADKIIVLEDGRAVGIGTHEELLRDCEVYQEIVAVQYPDTNSAGAAQK
jgi:ABC-type multidrug transport system fused ATPase/permease subunit